MFYITDVATGAGLAGSLAPERAGPAETPIFSCSLEEVRELVRCSPERERLWMRFEAFLTEADVARNFSHLHLTGPFFSRGERACEMEAALQTRSSLGPEAFAAMEPFLALGLREIRARYRVRLSFWVPGAPAGLLLIRGWAAAGPDARSRRREEATRQGIVRVELGAGR